LHAARKESFVYLVLTERLGYNAVVQTIQLDYMIPGLAKNSIRFLGEFSA